MRIQNMNLQWKIYITGYIMYALAKYLWFSKHANKNIQITYRNFKNNYQSQRREKECCINSHQMILRFKTQG